MTHSPEEKSTLIFGADFRCRNLDCVSLALDFMLLNICAFSALTLLVVKTRQAFIKL